MANQIKEKAVESQGTNTLPEGAEVDSAWWRQLDPAIVEKIALAVLGYPSHLCSFGLSRADFIIDPAPDLETTAEGA